MDLPRFNAISRYWRDHPPLHIIVAGLAGFKPQDEQAQLPDASEELPEFEE